MSECGKSEREKWEEGGGLDSRGEGATLVSQLLGLRRCRVRQRGGAELPRVIFVVSRAVDKVRREILWVGRLYGIASLWRGRAKERDGLEALGMVPGF